MATIAAIGLALSVVQVLYSSLRCEELMELVAMCGYSSEVRSLQRTVRTIRSVLLDAEAKQAQGPMLSHGELDLIEKLNDAVYDVDDLIDEVLTLAEQQRLQDSQKVLCLSSAFKELTVPCKISCEVKKIRKMLDEISKDDADFGSRIKYKPGSMRREVSSSHVTEENIYGRREDTSRIIDMLLDPKTQDPDVCVLSIVGMGGLGKTALAQLVYNHQRIKDVFTPRLWACISDQGTEQLNLTAIVADILKSEDSEIGCEGLGPQDLRRRLKRILNKKRYLLVLDDVWTESHDQWLRLANLLTGLGLRESRIVVTTRSQATAIAIESNIVYQLKGLSEEDSWHLFSKMAGEENAREFVDIGQDIVKRCANVPLAIRMVGSLLYGQDRTRWEAIHQCRLIDIGDGNNTIMPILRFSYHHLSPMQKGCFSYCAVFPKDFLIKKQTLISLWMAQGFVEPFIKGQSIEDAAKECFLILLRRCFFQDVEKDEYGEIEYCKMHDLIHDLAQGVAGKQIFTTDSTTFDLDENIRHVYDHTSLNRLGSSITRTKIRTYLRNEIRYQPLYNEVQFPVSTLVEKWMSLRALDLSRLDLQSLPVAIGKLLHLRYLDLCMNEKLGELPKSITKLINLQTLNLRQCQRLKKLPNDMNKLIKLRFLDVRYCGLSCMPPDMKKLTCLKWLPLFVVRNSSLKQRVSELEDLQTLKLKGHLTIEITEGYKYVKENDRTGEYLSNKGQLNDIEINCKGEMIMKYQEDLLEDLQPHSNLKRLSVSGYNGVRIPSWAREHNLTTFLPNLVTIELHCCNGFQELPWLGELPCLKTLVLNVLDNLECIEDTRNHNSSSRSEEAASSSTATAGSASSSRARETVSLFFPSLKVLHLCHLPKLTRWQRLPVSGHGSGSRVRPHRFMSFPCLSELTIEECRELRSIPLCPLVEKLTMTKFNERLRIITEQEQGAVGTSAEEYEDSRHLEIESQTVEKSYLISQAMEALRSLTEKLRFIPRYFTSGNLRRPKISTLTTDNMSYFKSIPMEAFQSLIDMVISDDNVLESLSEVKELFYSCSSSLRSLSITSCRNLLSLSGGLEHLTALESLSLTFLPRLSFNEEEEEEQIGVPWRCLPKSLHYLELQHMRMVRLPNGIQFLTALQSLIITFPGLEVLPEWIGCFSSLQTLQLLWAEELNVLPNTMQNLTSLSRLEVTGCPQCLEERCRKPNGEDWPKIQHIPKIRITTDWL